MPTTFVTLDLELAPGSSRELRTTLTGSGTPVVADAAPLDRGTRDEAWWADLAHRAAAVWDDDGDPAGVGAELSDMLLPPAIVVALRDLRSPTSHLAVVLRLGQGLERWRTLPWELVRADRKYLLSDEQVSIVRRAPTDVPPPGDRTIRRVAIVEGPRTIPRGDTLPESRLEDDIRVSLFDRDVVVGPVAGPTPESVGAHLATHGHADLLVYRGHGRTDGLWLDDPSGRFAAALAPSTKIVDAVRGRVTMVVLGSCHSGRSEADDGLAARLAEAGIFTVAFQCHVDPAAIDRFIVRFVSALAAGTEVVEAIARARPALRHGDNAVAPGAQSVVWMPHDRPPVVVVPPSRAERAPSVRRHPTDELAKAVRGDVVRIARLGGRRGTGRTTIVEQLALEPGLEVVAVDPPTSTEVARRLGEAFWRLARPTAPATWEERMRALGTDDHIWTELREQVLPAASDRRLALVLDDVDQLTKDQRTNLLLSLFGLPRWITPVVVSDVGLPVSHDADARLELDAADADGVLEDVVRSVLAGSVTPSTDLDDAVAEIVAALPWRSFTLAREAAAAHRPARSRSVRVGAITRRGLVHLVHAPARGLDLEPYPTSGDELEGDVVVSSDGRVAACLVGGELEVAWVNRAGPTLDPWSARVPVDLESPTLLAVGMVGEVGIRIVVTTATATHAGTAGVKELRLTELDQLHPSPSRAAVLARSGRFTVDADGVPRDGSLRRVLARLEAVRALDAAGDVVAAVGSGPEGDLLVTAVDGRARHRPIAPDVDGVVVVRPLDARPADTVLLLDAGARIETVQVER